ncbi:MAG: sensor histidine kinase [Anaerolineaceae bacterium]|nr:sensor histidine kinase [Anaerolineaceae bacterium]
MTVKWVHKLRNWEWLRHHPLLSLRGLPEIVAASGISVRLWRAYAQAWLVCLLFPILFLVQTPLTAVHLLITLAGLAIFVICYTWFMWPHPLTHETQRPIGLRTSLLVLTSLTALTLTLSLVYGSAFLWLFVGVSAMVGIALPAGGAFIVVVALTLLTLGVSVGISGGIAGSDWLHIVPLVLLVRGLGVDMIGVARLADALRELHAARDELARQAVMEERLRLARDLHDLLGHTLSMITLKSELAGRLIEKDSARAAQEIKDVERVARQALREVRTAVSGYRQPSLGSELDGAREILEAAGIACSIDNAVATVPSEADAALAWAVREGVTNVIRHSRARQCQIRISHTNETIQAEVHNDGYTGQNSDPVHMGSGLIGLAERFRLLGGSAQSGPAPLAGALGFRLVVRLPRQRIETRQERAA